MKSRSLVWSFNYAIEGVVWALKTQRNMRLHVAAAALTLLASVLLHIGRMGLVAVVFSISLVIMMELANTAIEAAVDVSTDHYDPLAKIAKDVGAGAVMVAALNALVVGYLVLFEPIKLVARNGLHLVKTSSADLTVVALGLTLLAVLALKAASREGTWLSGGWPSGHAALAFGAAMVLGYVTGSATALVLALFIASLVAQSRVEAEIHSVPQVILGALVGILLVTAAFQLFY